MTIVAAADGVYQVAADTHRLTILPLEMQRDGIDAKAGRDPAVAIAIVTVVVACPHLHVG